MQLWKVGGQTLPHQKDAEVPDGSCRNQTFSCWDPTFGVTDGASDVTFVSVEERQPVQR